MPGGMFDPVAYKKMLQDNATKADLKKQVADEGANKKYQDYITATSADPNATIRAPLTDIEKRSGVYRPGYESMRDRTTGQLRDIYKQNPFAGEAGQKLQQEAMSTGPSAWANMAMQKQGLEEQSGRDAAMKQQMQANSMAQSGLARTGGISSGARARMAQQGAKDALLAQQGVSRQGVMQRADIGTQDAARRQQLLGQVADAEKAAQAANVGLQAQDVTQKGQFDINAYKEQMGAYGAEKAAAAQRAAAGGGGKK